jgi:nucleotide-binding universal stress UspA family protein
VAELAALHDAEVMLLRVALAHAIPLADPVEAQVHAVEEAEGYLGDVERRLAARGMRVSHAVRYGDAAEEILDHARGRQAGLIAMSTHGRSGIRRLVMGSVAEAVLRASPVPVLLLRAAGPPAAEGETVKAAPAARPRQVEPAGPLVGHILCPVDFSRTADKAMEYAGALAQRFNADLTVLHVIYDPLDITCSHIPHPPLEQLREERIREAERLLERRVHRALGSVPRAKIAVVAGPPYARIIRYAREHQVDLIVMGTQGLSGLDRWIMGSTAERVVRTSPCPVVSIRAEAEPRQGGAGGGGEPCWSKSG